VLDNAVAKNEFERAVTPLPDIASVTLNDVERVVPKTRVTQRLKLRVIDGSRQIEKSDLKRHFDVLPYQRRSAEVYYARSRFGFHDS
jgi:hypothetical protein